MATPEETVVAKGNHAVPKGVAVEELDGGQKKLSEECPKELLELLEKNDAKSIYDKFVKTIADESDTRSLFGTWRDMEFDSIIDLFRQDFIEKNIKVVLCKRKSGMTAQRWIEFIDIVEASDYVPQYDVSNNSGQVIHTCYNKLEFPDGVAVEKLRRYGKARKALKENIPIYVEKMLGEHDLMGEYDALIDALCETDWSLITGAWKIDEVKPIVIEHRPKFEAKGVGLFVSHKQEWVQFGNHGGHMEYFRWIEFVDMEKQPNYHPQRDAESKKEKNCVIM